MTAREIKQRLFELQDVKFREFHSRLIPNIDPATVIGVRTPITVAGSMFGISREWNSRNFTSCSSKRRCFISLAVIKSSAVQPFPGLPCFIYRRASKSDA